MTRFDERVILLNGAARGLARATARLLSERGGSLGPRGYPRAGGGCPGCRAREDAKPFVADLSSVGEIGKTVESVLGAFGQIDVPINNAAICPRIPFGDATAEDWDRQFDNCGSKIDIYNVLDIKLDDGAIASLASTGATKPSERTYEVRVYGTEGRLFMDLWKGTMSYTRATDKCTNTRDSRHRTSTRSMPLLRTSLM